MAMPALKLEPEEPVEERIAILESDVKHIRADVSEVKIEIRRLGDKVDGLNTKIDVVKQHLSDKIDGVDRMLSDKIDGVDQRLSDKIDTVDKRQSARIEDLKDSIANLALATEKSFAALRVDRALDRVWWLLNSAALLGIMARAFRWI